MPFRAISGGVRDLFELRCQVFDEILPKTGSGSEEQGHGHRATDTGVLPLDIRDTRRQRVARVSYSSFLRLRKFIKFLNKNAYIQAKKPGKGL